MAFQAAIERAHQDNPQHGPRFEYSIQDITGMVRSLKDLLTFWSNQVQTAFPDQSFLISETVQAFCTSRPDLEQDLLRQLLTRLSEIADFQHTRTKNTVVIRVARMLQGAQQNERFREVLFPLIEGALGTCRDRITIEFGQIEIQWRIYCDNKQSDQDLVRLAIGLRHLELLDEVATATIQKRGLGDEIEARLYYQIQLKDSLDLPITIEAMSYPAMSGILQEDLVVAKQAVLAQTETFDAKIEILIQQDFWIERIQQKFTKEFEALNTSYGDRLAENLQPVEGLTEQEHLTSTRDTHTAWKEATHQLVRECTVAYCRAHRLL
jgi:hypothetical protein